jgi:hypothetical protein
MDIYQTIVTGRAAGTRPQIDFLYSSLAEALRK